MFALAKTLAMDLSAPNLRCTEIVEPHNYLNFNVIRLRSCKRPTELTEPQEHGRVRRLHSHAATEEHFKGHINSVDNTWIRGRDGGFDVRKL